MNLKDKKGLLIAEKNSLMKSIKEVYEKHKADLGYDVDFVCQSGHLLTLLTPDKLDEKFKVWSWETLPIKPEEYGGFKYKVIPGKENLYNEIKKRIHSGKYDFIIHAGDPDQEGELLINIVLDQAKNTLPVYRFYTNSIADEKILDALKNLRNEASDEKLKNLLDAAFARQHSDYRVGMNLSRAATLKMNSRVALGRVKTPILSIIVQREDAIENFKPKTVYGVKSNYEEGFQGSLFDDKKNDDNKGSDLIFFDDKTQAEDLIEKLPNSGVVESCEINQSKTYADKLFKLSTAQVEANKLFGYKPKETDEILENLYLKKYITYPRSSLEYLGSKEDLIGPLKAVAQVFDEFAYIANGISDKDLKSVMSNKKFINDEKVNADAEGHSAIIPTGTPPSLSGLTDKEINIYNMIARRYVAIFMPPLIQDKLKLIADIGGYKFKSTASKVIDPGYTELYHNKTLANDKFVELKSGDTLNVTKFEVSESKNQKPRRFTSASLIELLDDPSKFLYDESLKSLGKFPIGTPATRSNIIEELIKKDKYLKEEKEGKKDVLKPTGVGELIIRNLQDTDITKVDMTGIWENKLSQIRSGELDFDTFENQMMDDVERMISDIKTKDMRQIKDTKNFEKIATCPKCGGDLIKGPKSFFCSNYKEGCRVGGFLVQYGATVTTEEFLDMINDGKTFNKKFTFKGKSWNQDIGVNEEGTITLITVENPTDYICPACGKSIIETDKGYFCEGSKDKSCNVRLFKNVKGVHITEEMAKDFFIKGETGKIAGFKTKNGNPYLAVFKVSKDDKKVLMEAFEPTAETKFECPVCNRPLVKGNFKYMCVGNEDHSCEFSMYSKSFNEDIPDSRVSELLEYVRNGSISGGEYAYVSKEPVDTGQKCSFCGGKILRKDSHFYCENTEKNRCHLDFYRNVGNEIMDDADIENLFLAGKTRVFTLIGKDGKPYSLRRVLDYDKQNVVSQYENIETTSKYNCPICGKKLKKEGLKYTCECGFSMFAMVNGQKISDKDLEHLFKYKETDSVYPIKTKKGPAKVKVVVDEFDRKTTFKFVD